MSPDETLIESRSYARQNSHRIGESVKRFPSRASPSVIVSAARKSACAARFAGSTACNLAPHEQITRSKRVFMLQSSIAIVCVSRLFHTKHIQEAASSAVTQCMARRSSLACARQKQGPVYAGPGTTAGTTVIYEDRLST
ncbi:MULTISPECIES: hypothetical protein [unclassified Burkholderia]|uniref:hypothetical protein n=1 Tax=unclassified Burkholderia TaxID=2613784 RepID=UPI00158A106F|nr:MULTISPECIES: hypothetical protein [unclassified Burkholderia]